VHGHETCKNRAKVGEKVTGDRCSFRYVGTFPRKKDHSTIQVSYRLADYASMPNLYFCQPHAKNQGMLRAVLSLNECEQVVSKHHVQFFGETFPSFSEGPADARDFAVLRFAAEETSEKWKPGFYRVESDLNKLNDDLRELQR
jgi:hypothetical protein